MGRAAVVAAAGERRSAAPSRSATATLSLGDGAPSQGAIAAFLGTSHQNVRQLLDGLERKGLVVVEVDPLDRRSRRVRATEAVAPLFAGRDEADHAAVRAWFGALDDDELEVACRLLHKVSEGLADGAPRRGTP